MKSKNSPRINLSPRGAMFSIRNMAMVITLGICGAVGSAAVHAQETAGSVFGRAPVGETITAQSTTGIHRHVKANAKGRYVIGSLPLGTYSVTLEKDGHPVETHLNVNVIVGRGQQVDFTCGGVKCTAVVSN
ncbi:MAG TPA: carboxypeptidase-like regulatory domain-containing protein [Rhodanobacter sp.]